ncbi:MAG: DUF3784 domain-containing protein [Methanomicrobiales archaeon]|nr:DUF3784 domain-containing protein [Methanomicrobiales archaeon]
MVWIANALGGVIVLVIGIIIRAFNVSSLIAGYNTASAEEQEKYDERALTRFVGNLLITASAILLAGGLLDVATGARGAIVSASWLAFVALLIGGVVYANTGGRFQR